MPTRLSRGCWSPRNVLHFLSPRRETVPNQSPKSCLFFSFLVLQTAPDPSVAPPLFFSPSLGCAHSEGLPIHFRWVMLWDLTPAQRWKLHNSMSVDGPCNVNYMRPPAARALHSPAGFWRTMSNFCNSAVVSACPISRSLWFIVLLVFTQDIL